MDKDKVYSPAYQEEIEVNNKYDYYYFRLFNGDNYEQAVAYALTMETRLDD